LPIQTLRLPTMLAGHHRDNTTRRDAKPSPPKRHGPEIKASTNHASRPRALVALSLGQGTARMVDQLVDATIRFRVQLGKHHDRPPGHWLSERTMRGGLVIIPPSWP
jgi:hypothetical protein